MSRADDLRRFLSNARHPGEAWRTYLRRRREANKAVRAQLRGRLVHEATRSFMVFLEDLASVTHQLENGDVRRMGPPVTRKDGRVVVPLRTKGITYRRPAP